MMSCGKVVIASNTANTAVSENTGECHSYMREERESAQQSGYHTYDIHFIAWEGFIYERIIGQNRIIHRFTDPADDEGLQ